MKFRRPEGSAEYAVISGQNDRTPRFISEKLLRCGRFTHFKVGVSVCIVCGNIIVFAVVIGYNRVRPRMVFNRKFKSPYNHFAG